MQSPEVNDEWEAWVQERVHNDGEGEAPQSKWPISPPQGNKRLESGIGLAPPDRFLDHTRQLNVSGRNDCNPGVRAEMTSAEDLETEFTEWILTISTSSSHSMTLEYS